MKNNLKSNAALNSKIQNVEKEIQPSLYEQSFETNIVSEETIKDLNDKILQITLRIKDEYPELSKYLEEMETTIPDVKNPKITLENLEKYYDSLSTMLNKYILEQAIIEKKG